MLKQVLTISVMSGLLAVPVFAQTECSEFRYGITNKVSAVGDPLMKITELISANNYKAACAEARSMVANVAAVRKDLDAKKGQCRELWQSLSPTLDQYNAQGKEMAALVCK